MIKRGLVHNRKIWTKQCDIKKKINWNKEIYNERKEEFQKFMMLDNAKNIRRKLKKIKYGEKIRKWIKRIWLKYIIIGLGKFRKLENQCLDSKEK